ncbi:MAG TPA: MIP/aquaporin family protein [Promineifilum sp.]|nr:MIP/aquaporin family protein [Promineifilum sp.]
MSKPSVARAVVAEGVGTGLLVACVVGSGIMALDLSGGNTGLALLANSLATAAVLVVLVTSLGPVSGAHFNPAVTLASALTGKLGRGLAVAYVASQVLGGFLGTTLAHAMFEQALWQHATHERSGQGQMIGEFVAAFGLMFAIVLTARHRPSAVAAAVGLYIGSAYWFTSSTSFANPAVTLARAFSDTFSGIRLIDVPAFVVAQLVGAYCGALLAGWLAEETRPT